MSCFVETIRHCTDMLFPGTCPVCKVRRIDPPFPICSVCSSLVHSGKRLYPYCTKNIAVIRSCRPYDGLTRECLRQFKYQRKKGMIRVLRELINEYFLRNTDIFRDIDLIIPVPVSSHRHTQRGYNQAGLIAAVLSEISMLPLLENNLVKIRNTPSQTSFSRKERMANLKGAFAIKKPGDITTRSLLLVDDIITTGATLEICATELFRSGARKIEGFTIARTL